MTRAEQIVEVLSGDDEFAGDMKEFQQPPWEEFQVNDVVAYKEEHHYGGSLVLRGTVMRQFGNDLDKIPTYQVEFIVSNGTPYRDIVSALELELVARYPSLREANWLKRLKRLRARRDPDGIEENENEDDDRVDLKEIGSPGNFRILPVSGNQRLFNVYEEESGLIGIIHSLGNDMVEIMWVAPKFRWTTMRTPVPSQVIDHFDPGFVTIHRPAESLHTAFQHLERLFHSRKEELR